MSLFVFLHLSRRHFASFLVEPLTIRRITSGDECGDPREALIQTALQIAACSWCLQFPLTTSCRSWAIKREPRASRCPLASSRSPSTLLPYSGPPVGCGIPLCMLFCSPTHCKAMTHTVPSLAIPLSHDPSPVRAGRRRGGVGVCRCISGHACEEWGPGGGPLSTDPIRTYTRLSVALPQLGLGVPLVCVWETARAALGDVWGFWLLGLAWCYSLLLVAWNGDGPGWILL